MYNLVIKGCTFELEHTSSGVLHNLSGSPFPYLQNESNALLRGVNVIMNLKHLAQTLVQRKCSLNARW